MFRLFRVVFKLLLFSLASQGMAFEADVGNPATDAEGSEAALDAAQGVDSLCDTRAANALPRLLTMTPSD